MGDKKAKGKYESSNKKRTPTSYKGKYEKKRETSRYESTERIKKSQQDEEKIKAAEAVIEKYRPMLEELSGATWDIISGTIMRPIHEKLEKIQAEFDSRKESLDKVNRYESQINSAIEKRKKAQIEKLEKLEQSLDKDIKSEDLEDKVGMRTMRVLTRTMVGSFSARVSKMPYTLAARYQALMGNDEKRNELLKKARKISGRKVKKIRQKNEAYNNKTRSRVKKFNEVEEQTDNYDMRKSKVEALNGLEDKFLKKNEKGSVRRNISLNIAKTASKRIYRGEKISEIIEDVGNWIGRKAALSGLDDIADFASKHTSNLANSVLRTVGKRNNRSYQTLNRRVDAYDEVASTAKYTIESLKRKQIASKSKADAWEKNQTSTGFTTRIGTEGVKAVNRATTSSAKFVGKSDMKIAELYAKSVSLIGFDEYGKTVAEKAEIRSQRRMDKAEEFNKKLRAGTDRVFGFKERRKENIIAAGKFFKELGGGLNLEITETWNETKGAFGDFMSEIESRKAQHQLKRRFKAAERKESNLGVKESILKYFSDKASSVVRKLDTSLENVRLEQQSAQSEKIAAQAELKLNPEKNKKVTSKKDIDVEREFDE